MKYFAVAVIFAMLVTISLAGFHEPIIIKKPVAKISYKPVKTISYVPVKSISYKPVITTAHKPVVSYSFKPFILSSGHGHGWH